MDERRAEELLRARTERHRAEPLAAGAAERLRARLSEERAADSRRRSSHLRLLAVALAAAAAVLVLLQTQRPAETGGRGALPVTVALLDSAGRRLARGPEVRGTGATFRRPSEVVIELVAEGDGFVWTFVCDPAGRIDPDRAQPLAAGEDLLWSHSLEGYETSAGKDAYVSILVLAAKRAIAPEQLADAIPRELETSSDRDAALARLAEDLARRFGCTSTVRTLLLEEAAQ